MNVPDSELNKTTSISTISSEDVSRSGSSISYPNGHVELENSAILFPIDEKDCRSWESHFAPRYSFEHQHDSIIRTYSNDSFITYSDISTPVLPRIADHAKASLCKENGQMEILPCPSAQVTRPRIDGEDKFVDRYELLNSLRSQSVLKEYKSGVSNKQNTKARWQRRMGQIASQAKARKLEMVESGQDMAAQRSFFCFILGFLFPPLWIAGALRNPS
ncbi:hypothetical protein EC973_009599, partial [Apophysomyces ossiformis]